ncbi:MAG: TIGR00295 family protein [Thermoplasmata archaeon]|nr:TIGR00295 family protein [Thermoplasmata archaeon]
METLVYRYGHRIARDKRITTHVALVARAFGADGIIIDTEDKTIEDGINKVVDRFGGDFSIKTGIPWRRFFNEWDGKIVHLTMYGIPVDRVIEDIRKEEKILVVVGSEKVPGDFYRIADYNVAIGNQPHSEVASLAVFLHFLNEGEWLRKEFGGIIKIIPSERGKKIEYDYIKMLEVEGCSKAVINHCIKVAELAVEIAKKIRENGNNVDIDAVRAGALLHDIGRSRTHGIMHVVEGVKIARKYSLPPKIIDIIEHHVGAGIDADEAEKLGLPREDYIPKSIEEKIVAHADNLTSYGYRTVDEVAEKWRKKIGENAVKKLLAMHEELSKLAGMDIDDIVAMMKNKNK